MLIAKQIAEKFEGKILGDENATFTIFSSIKDSDIPRDSICYINDKKYYKVLENVLANIVIIPIEDDENTLNLLKNSKPTLIMIKNHVFVFISILRDWYFLNKEKRIGISRKSVISNDIKIGKNLYIGDNVVIKKGTFIGDGCEIYSNTFFGENVKIGVNNVIYPNVSIMRGIEIANNVLIHSGVTIGNDGLVFCLIKHFI